MTKVLVTQSKLDTLAEIVGGKSNTNVPLTIDEMITAADSITNGGGITPTGNIDITSAGVTDVTNYATATVPQGEMYAGYENGYVTVSGARKYKFQPYAAVNLGDGFGSPGYIEDETIEYGTAQTYNAIAKNTTVTPSTSSQTIGGANYMMEGAVTVSAMPSGTAGTPTATKGAVNNHAISVTPSVTNTTGYITGGTKTGTAVSVSASELVSGTLSISQNGTADVTNYASVDVSVSGGGGSTDPSISGTSTELSSASSTITFTDLEGEPTSFIVSCDDNLATGASPFKVAAVVYDGTSLHGQTITNTNNAQVTYDNSGFSYTYNNGTLTITSTGAYFQPKVYVIAYSYDGGIVNTKDVQVGSGATSISFTGLEDEPAYWSCIFKSNFATSSGYQRVIWTAYTGFGGSGVYGQAMDSQANLSGNWTASYNNGTLTITSTGTNAGGYFHQPGYYQLTYAVSGDGSLQTKTVTPDSTTQNVEADQGYTALKKVVVNPIPSSYVQPSATQGATTYRASTATQTIPSGTYLTGSQTFASVSQTNLTADNIKSGTTVTISNGQSNLWSVTGTYSGGGGSSMNTQTVQSTSRRNSTSLGSITSLTCSKAGTYDIYWTCTRSNTSQTWGSQLYINNSAYGTENTTWSNNVQNNKLTGVTLSANQTVAVYGRSRNGYYIYAPQLTIVQTA